MKLFKSILILFTVLISTQKLSAQNMKVTGTVYDTTGTKPLHNALVMGVRIKDSLLLSFTRTNDKGNFVLQNFKADTFSLVIAHPYFDDKTYFIFGNSNNSTIEIPSITMAGKMKDLDEVVIYANKNPIYYKGDTLVYVADSFNVNEGAVVEDLLKKLPGIKIDKDGKITSQGQDIQKVLVDGDEFFGSDPTIATKNLGADGVQTVEVYEKTNDETIGGSDEKIKVLDLKLKEDAKKGYFGKITAASDLGLTPKGNQDNKTPFYEGELLLNKFSGSQKISIFALGSNTPRSSLGRGDMKKFGLSNENGVNGNFWEPDKINNTGGIPQTLKTGIYYTDKFGKKKNTTFLFNYSYYNEQMDAKSSSVSSYFLTDTTFYTSNDQRNISKDETHNFNIALTSKLDSLTTVTLKPSFQLAKNSIDNSDLTSFRSETQDTSLRTEVFNNQITDVSNFNNTLKLERKFMKKRREMVVQYDLSLGNNQSDGFLFTQRKFLLFSAIDTLDQKKTNIYNNNSHIGTISYYEPISKTMKLNFTYLFEYGLISQSKETFDKQNGIYSSLRNDLSNTFDNIRLQNRGGLDLVFEKGKHTIVAGTKFRNIQIDNFNRIIDTSITQNINNVLPNFEYRFKPSVAKHFNVKYQTYSQQPSISDIQPVIDNSNPNQIQIGNPELKPNYVQNFSANYNNWNAMTGRYIWAGANFMLLNNDFTTEMVFDQYGRTLFRSVNVDGNMNASVWTGGGYNILDRKIEFAPSITGSFNRYNNFIDSVANRTDNFSIQPTLDIDFEFDSLEIGLSGSYSYNRPTSTLSSASRAPFSRENYSLNVKWTLPKGFIIQTDGTYFRNTQPGQGFFDNEFFVWNAELSKKFLKTQNFIVSIVANDILNQNINANRTVNGNMITDFRTTIISRYFLLKAVYKFNNRKTKEDDFKGWH